MPLFIPDYNYLSVHKLLLSDNIRTHAYCKAIAQKVKKDSIAIDLGAGTGILALAAANSGANKVYAIERTKIADVAEVIINKNKFHDRIEVIKCDSSNVNLMNKADLLVSEWIGVHILQENMLFDFIDLRDSALKTGGILIPEAVEMWIAPLIKNPSVYEEIEKWKEPVEGFDFSEIPELSANDVYISKILPEYLASEGNLVHTIDLYTVQRFHKLQIKNSFKINKTGPIQGICGWFKAQLTKDISFDTSPEALPTHWQQTIYPIYPEIQAQKSDILKIAFEFEPAGKYVNISWRATIEGREKESSRSFSTKNNYTLPAS